MPPSDLERNLQEARDVTVSNAPAARSPDFGAHDWTGTEVSAELVRSVLLSGPDSGIEARSLLRIHGARITGVLDLTGIRLNRALELTNCRFEAGIVLDDAELPRVRLSGSWLPGVSARRLRCDLFRLDEGSVVEGGTVDEAAVRLAAAELGRAEFGGSMIRNPGGVAVDANVLTASRSVNLNLGFVAVGRVRFIGATVAGQLNLRRSYFDSAGSRKNAITLHEATIGRALYLREAVVVGNVRISGARISARFDCVDAILLSSEGIGLYLDGSSIERAIQLRGTVACRRVQMIGTKVGGLLDLRDAVLVGAPTDVVDAERLREIGLIETREERLAAMAAFRTEVLRSLELGAGIPESDAEPVLRVDRATLGSSVYFGAAIFTGAVRLTSSMVAKRLDAESTTILNPDKTALDLSESQFGIGIVLRSPQSIKGVIRLHHTRAGHITDTPDSWPAEVELAGLVYDSLEIDHDGWTLRKRLEWIGRQVAHAGQPYSQLAKLLSESGRSDDARKVLQRREQERRRRQAIPMWRRVMSLVSGVFAGHGYRPEFAVAWLFGLVVLGTLFYQRAWQEHAIAHADKRQERAAYRCMDKAPCFNEWAVAADQVLPIIDLGYADVWVIRSVHGRDGIFQTGPVVLNVAGWVLTTVAVAGVTRRAVRP